MRTLRIPLRAVLYRDEGKWLVRCLEFDIVGHGATQRQALEMLSGAIVTQVQATVKYGTAENLFSPAEPRYFVMFAAGTVVGKQAFEGAVTLRAADVVIEDVETREYSGSDAELALA